MEWQHPHSSRGCGRSRISEKTTRTTALLRVGKILHSKVDLKALSKECLCYVYISCGLVSCWCGILINSFFFIFLSKSFYSRFRRLGDRLSIFYCSKYSGVDSHMVLQLSDERPQTRCGDYLPKTVGSSWICNWRCIFVILSH